MLNCDNSKYSLLRLIFTIAFIVVIISACSIEKPQAPKWTTSWKIPIVNERYDIVELIDGINDFDIDIDSAGNPTFEFTDSINSFEVGNRLSIDEVDFDFEDSIGVLSLEPPAPVEASTDIDDILPVNLGVILPCIFNFQQNITAIENYSWIDVESGQMSLTFSNTLEADLDTFTVTLVDLDDGHVIGFENFEGGLPYNSTKSMIVDLTGQRISNTFSAAFYGVVCDTALILNMSDPHEIGVSTAFVGDVRVAAGQMETPEVSITKIEKTEVPDSTQVISASIESGTLEINVTNNTNFPFRADILTDNIKNEDNESMFVSEMISANSSVEIFRDLSNYQFIPEDSAGEKYIVISFSAFTAESNPDQRIFHKSDGIDIDIDISEISFTSVTGRIEPTVIEIDPITQDLDVPEGLDKAFLTKATLELNLYNNSLVDADVDLSIEGEGKTVNVFERISGKNSVNDPPKLNVITLTSDQLADFLNPPPTTINITGQAIINPNFEVSTVTSCDEFYGDVRLFTPFAFAITQPVDVEVDVSETELDDDAIPENVHDTFRYGNFDIEIESHIPLGLTMSLYIGTQSDTSALFEDPNTIVLGPDTLYSGETDNNGYVINSVISNLSHSLNNDDLDIFENDTIYVVPKICLLPTDSSGVYVLGSDYVALKANALMEVQIGDNLWEKD